MRDLKSITDDNETLVGLFFTSFETGTTFKIERVVEYDDDGFGVELVEVSDQRSGEIKVMSPQTIRFAVSKPPHF